MLDFLRDPIWQFLGVLGTVVVAAVVYFAQRQRKDVTYELLSNTPLLTVREKGLGQLQLTHNGVAVENPRLAVIRGTKGVSIAFHLEQHCHVSHVLN